MSKNTQKFASADDGDEVAIPEAQVVETETVVNDNLVTARVKGTWTFHWGLSVYNFVDGNRYRLPRDLFNYLKSYGNIYDTL